MSTIEATETNPEALWAACSAIAATDPKTFSRVTQKGLSLDLKSAVPVVDRIVSFYKRVTPEDISMMPENRVNIFSQEVFNVQEVFREIQEMRYQDPDGARDRLREVYHSMRTELTPFVAPDTVDAANSKAQFEDLIDQANAARQETERIRGQAKDIVAELRKVAAKGGVTKYATIFRDAAKKHQRQQRGWLGALGVLSLLAMAVAWWIGVELQPPSDVSLSLAIQMTAVKLFVFGILSYVILMAGRAYRAAAHNQIVNEHRRDALETFQTFVKASSDEATKDAVLVQATHSIFSHRPSGFGQQESDAMPPSHMVELTRSVMGDRGSTV